MLKVTNSMSKLSTVNITNLISHLTSSCGLLWNYGLLWNFSPRWTSWTQLVLSHMYESCHTYMIHVTHVWVMSHWRMCCPPTLCDKLMWNCSRRYGVATVSRIDKIIGLFCKRALLMRLCSAKETYNLIDPTDCRHPINVTNSTSPVTHIQVMFHDSMSRTPVVYRSSWHRVMPCHTYPSHVPFIHVWYDSASRTPVKLRTKV